MENDKACTKRGLVERLAAGEHILCAEGYLLALCRMGYITHGMWIPEFILEHPEVLRTVHYEFVHAGTDVTEAFQYFTHREKMRKIGREDDLEKINRIALKMAREVADDTGDMDTERMIRNMFEEQVRWSKEEGAEYIIAETIQYFREAEIALEVILSFDLPAVITMSVLGESDFQTTDGVPIGKACRALLDKGATLVGSNCYRGPNTMLKVIKEIVKEVPPEKVCALPVMYRTTDGQPTFFHLKDDSCPINDPVYPHGLDAVQICSREVMDFTSKCLEIGLKYIGLCCGNTGNYTRAMAEAMGRKPPASKYLDLSIKNPLLKMLEEKKEEKNED